jgi:hypothetical protein
MYALVECVMIAALTLCLGASIFLIIAAVILLQTAIARIVVDRSLPMTQAPVEHGLTDDPIAVPGQLAQ